MISMVLFAFLALNDICNGSDLMRTHEALMTFMGFRTSPLLTLFLELTNVNEL